ncbi:DUF2520 domain-containing protein [Candidatus Amarobacter glycogenicus]|uniref:Rossmann-like and DUF2520 domain-containing protein n=1 Tax=Candidatus Amarobacter glycogenicus TaxID=3140699 RepID=UPI0031364BF5|nr:DUF2520 domain-containing protein [Dehalococcoidia bacterium]
MTTDSPLVGIVGAGRLGGALAVGLSRAGYRIGAIGSTRISSASAVAEAIGGVAEATADVTRVAAVCDLVFFTVPDSAVESSCDTVRWTPRHMVVHCSGALTLDALKSAASVAAVGCLHPLQTFPSRLPEPDRFHGIFCGVEGTTGLGETLERMAAALGASVVRLEGSNRALYHAAAVMMSNNAVALAAAASRLWALAGLPPDLGRPALSPLLQAAAANIGKLELVDALTGPIARGDLATVTAHLRALQGEPELLVLYRLLAGELLRLSLPHSEGTARLLREVLGS